MKLREILTEKYFEGNPNIQGKYLELLLSLISTADEFSECEVRLSKDAKKSLTHKFENGRKYKGIYYIYSISETPLIYDPNKLYEPVKDGGAITPTFYDPLNFTPYKKIILQLSPEASESDEYKKEKLRNLLNDILDRPEDYQSKGERGFLIKGYVQDK